jgi:type I restriction enzyme S subunit
MSVPKLRFKEFSGDFEKNKLVEYTKWSSGGTPSKDNDEYWNGDIPLISGASMHTQKFFESDVNITELGLKKGSKLAPKDSILILVRGSMLFNKIPMGLTLKDVAFNQDVKCIQPTQSLNSSFLFQWFLAKENIIQNKVTSTGIGAGKLDTADLQNLEIVVPKLEEQTQIASFLSSVDEKISQLTQKHELLSQYKQGMMQKLFSQKIRFKADDGSEFGEWVESKITDVADYVDYRGKTPKKVEDGILLVTAKNIRFGYIDYSVSQEYICSDDFDEVMRRGRAEIGDVLITTEAPLGNVASVDRENIALAQRVIKYRGKKGILNNEFLKQKFLSEEFQSLISSKATGGTVQGIKGSTLHNLEIHIPEDIEEQTKIASFLSGIEQKIEVVAQQIEQAKLWKKSLLQQMFG